MNLFHITGYDIGLVCNGFVYHTKYDQYDIIPRASIQNTGDNLLALAKALANAPELADTTVSNSTTEKVLLNTL